MPAELELGASRFWLACRGICKALAEESASSRGIRRCRRSLENQGSSSKRPSIDLPTSVTFPQTVADLLWFKAASSEHVPSLWFFTASMVSSARRMRAYCIPLPIMGFAVFQNLGYRAPARSGHKHHVAMAVGAAKIILNDANHTPRRTPLHKSRVVSPQPLPPCRFDDSEALLLCEVRTKGSPLPVNHGLSFHGLCSPSRSIPDSLCYPSNSEWFTIREECESFDPHLTRVYEQQP